MGRNERKKLTIEILTLFGTNGTEALNNVVFAAEKEFVIIKKYIKKKYYSIIHNHIFGF